MKNVFAYIRVSTVKQGLKGSSLQEQKAAIERYVDQQGLHVVAWFEEQETADFIPRHGGHLSMVQAALRMMYRAIIRETGEHGPIVREMMIVSMVNGASTRAQAKPDWLTDAEIGHHVCAILANPARFPGPVEVLRSRAQVGQPAQAL